MRVSRIIPMLALVACGGLALWGQTAENPGAANGVHEITLPRYQPDLPPGPGREAFATACLGCHTDRYISTQPPFPEAKWEAEVKKMVKTYGCYVTDEQVPQIAQYAIFLQKSPEGKMIVPVPPQEPGPDVQAVASDEMKEAGQALFAKDCMVCHVAALHSSSQSKLALPLPTDLSCDAFSSARLASAIHNGVPGTAMPAFAYLNNHDLQALMVYVQSLSPMPQKVSGTEDARQLYMTDCLSCHGADGRGDGFAAAALARPAADFTAEQPNAEFAYRAISDGISGTSMPQWKTKLSEQQRHELADYVRSLYAGAK
ncbi:MAG TPA: c-type cytochrome [Tepidisphaeraceae bacterium]|jgi:mono/diheme cytochrome c family protein